MADILDYDVIVARSSSSLLKQLAPKLEPVSFCSSYVLGWVRSAALSAEPKTA